MTLNQWIGIALAAVCCCTACKERPAVQPITKSNAHVLSEPLSSVTGTYTGFFEPDGGISMIDTANRDTVSLPANKITVCIDQLGDGQVSGYSVCAGNERPFTGTYEEKDNVIEATFKEPGSNKYDGVFSAVISKNDHTLSGQWKPYNTSQPGRHYTLARKNFKYNASLGQHPETSMRLLTAEDVNNLYKDELRYMRNEIYARHGYSFKLRDVREMFDQQDWYMPISTDVRKKLSAIEVKNEVLIKHFEKYAEDAYDDYGR